MLDTLRIRHPSTETRSRVLQEARDIGSSQETTHDRAFRQYLLTGASRGLERGHFERLSPGEVRYFEQRAGQEVQSLNTGGYWVSEEFRDQLIQAAETESVMRKVCPILTTTTGGDLTLPSIDDVATVGTKQAEGTAVTRTDFAASRLVISTFMVDSDVVLVSWALAQDLGANLENYLSSILGKRIARRQNHGLTVGQSPDEPGGIATSAAVTVTAVATGAITGDEVINLAASIDDSLMFNPGSAYMMNATTYREARKLKDGDGRPLWLPDPSGVNPRGVLNGYPVHINKDMAGMSAGQKPIIVADFDKSYMIRDVQQVRLARLSERYVANGQIGFIGHVRYGGILLTVGSVPAAVALQMAA